MKVKKISTKLLPFGKNEGAVVTEVLVGEGIPTGASKIRDNIVDLDNDLVYIKADFFNNSELAEVFRSLKSTKYKIILNTDSGDEFGSIVRYKNVFFSILVDIPKEGVEPNFNSRLIGYMQGKDELRFKINSLEEYRDFKKFVNLKKIGALTKILEVKEDIKVIFEKELFSDITVDGNIIIKYIKGE